MPPTFTPPTIEVGTVMTVGGMSVGGVKVSGRPYRTYSGPPMKDEAHSVVMALEAAMHAEWATLEQQKEVVKVIARELKARRGALHDRK